MLFKQKHAVSFFRKIKILYFPCISFLILIVFLNLRENLNNQEKYSGDFHPSSEIEKEYRRKFNLMKGPAEIGHKCTLEYINEHKLEQDHPCVIELIRRLFLTPPSPLDVPYNLTDNTPDYAPGPVERELKETQDFLLKNKKNGFFVECGAFDGFFLSNSLDAELNQNWTGLLIEASPTNYQSLLARNRKAWTSNVCLSLMPYPTKISFTTSENPVFSSHATFRIIETDEKGNKIYNHDSDDRFGISKMKTIQIQCFPFYSILLASNQTTIDYFSLDIEGHEKRVLETIPWRKVDIKIMRIETEHIPSEANTKSGSDALKEFLEADPGYVNFKKIRNDEFYIKNYVTNQDW